MNTHPEPEQRSTAADETTPLPVAPATAALPAEEPFWTSDRAGRPDAAPSASVDSAPVNPAPADPAPAGRRPPRVSTLALGALMLLVAVAVLVAALADLSIDLGALLLVALVLAGLALLAGGVAAAAKEARGGPGA